MMVKDLRINTPQALCDKIVIDALEKEGNR